MIESKTKEIGGHTYTVEQFGALEGRRVMVQLAKALGPALAKIAAGGDGDEARVVSALEGLAEGIDPDLFDELCNRFAKRTRVRVDGREPKLDEIFDLHFAAKYLDMIQWLAFAIQVNFLGFLGEGTDLGALLRGAKERSPSPSPSTSTGSSGA